MSFFRLSVLLSTLHAANMYLGTDFGENGVGPTQENIKLFVIQIIS